MYAIPLDGNVRQRTNDSLREYARLEYRREDFLWLRTTARAAKRPARIRNPLGLLTPRRKPGHAPVACKGSPRHLPREAPTSG